jgi:hypothetical protein
MEQRDEELREATVDDRSTNTREAINGDDTIMVHTPTHNHITKRNDTT